MAFGCDSAIVSVTLPIELVVEPRRKEVRRSTSCELELGNGNDDRLEVGELTSCTARKAGEVIFVL